MLFTLPVLVISVTLMATREIRVTLITLPVLVISVTLISRVTIITY